MRPGEAEHVSDKDILNSIVGPSVQIRGLNVTLSSISGVSGEHNYARYLEQRLLSPYVIWRTSVHPTTHHRAYVYRRVALSSRILPCRIAMQLYDLPRAGISAVAIASSAALRGDWKAN